MSDYYQFRNETGTPIDYYQLVNDNNELCAEIERLNNIINKAIEYIEKNSTDYGEGKWQYSTINANNVLSILRGSAKK